MVTTPLSDVQARPANPDDIAALRRQIDLAEKVSAAAETSAWEAAYHCGYADAMRWVLKHRMGVTP